MLLSDALISHEVNMLGLIDVLYKIKQSKNTRIKIVTDSAVIDTDFKTSNAYPELVNFINQTK